jgi:cell division protein FtsL
MKGRAAHAHLHLNARMVREKDRARARDLRRLLLYAAAIVVPLLVYVWQRVEFLQLSYSVEALKKERQELMEMQKELMVERSLLLAPDRVERLARRQLGLVDPPPEDVRRVVLIDGRVNEVHGPVAGDSQENQGWMHAAAAAFLHPPAAGGHP